MQDGGGRSWPGAALGPGESEPFDLKGDRLPALVRGHHEQVYLDIELHAHKVGHSQQSGVDGRGALHIEGGNYGIFKVSIQTFLYQ